MVSGPARDHSERDRLSDGKGFIRPPDYRHGGEGAKDRDSIYFRFTGSRLAAIGSLRDLRKTVIKGKELKRNNI